MSPQSRSEKQALLRVEEEGGDEMKSTKEMIERDREKSVGK